MSIKHFFSLCCLQSGFSSMLCVYYFTHIFILMLKYVLCDGLKPWSKKLRKVLLSNKKKNWFTSGVDKHSYEVAISRQFSLQICEKNLNHNLGFDLEIVALKSSKTKTGIRFFLLNRLGGDLKNHQGIFLPELSKLLTY